MISKDKKYKTKNGYEYRYYSSDGVPPLNIHGAFKKGDGWVSCTHTNAGKYSVHCDTPYDLVEVKSEYMVISNGIGNSIYLDGKRIDPQQLPEGKYKLIPIEDEKG